MIYFSSLLKTAAEYKPAADGLFAALAAAGIGFSFVDNTKDVWLRDFMPVATKSGKLVAFRYEPSYLKEYPDLKTNFRDIADSLPISVTYSDINLDGGNVVFSPSHEIAIISERAFAENPGLSRAALTARLEHLLETEIIWIESLPSDMTGHADGMVRFVDEHTVLSNRTDFQNGLEQRNRRRLERAGLRVIDFPYEQGRGISAEGCYLNYLQTQRHLFLPVFGLPQDAEAESTARALFRQQVVPVPAAGLARHGGVFHCVSWADEAHP